MDIPPAQRWLTRERKCSSSLCKQSPYRSCLPNEKRVTNIQNPSQTGLRTQGDGHFRTHGALLPSQLRQRVRKARPFERLLSAPSAAHSDLFIRQPRYFLSCDLAMK